MKRVFSLMLVVILMSAAISHSMDFSGDATGVSTYVWRGVKQFNGPALQSTASFTTGFFTAGLWTSNMHGPMEVETDPFIEASIPLAEFSAAVGATLYSYDFFAKSEYNFYEFYGSARYGQFSAALFFTPEQSNTDDSVYWLEISAGRAVMGVDISGTLGSGTYSSTTDNVVTSLLISAAKPVTDSFTASWNYSIGLSDELESIFFIGASYGF